MDILTLVLIIQAMVVSLFVWLLYDTRKEARDREKRGNERELQLISVSQILSNQLPVVAASLQKIEQRLEYWGQRERGVKSDS